MANIYLGVTLSNGETADRIAIDIPDMKAADDLLDLLQSVKSAVVPFTAPGGITGKVLLNMPNIAAVAIIESEEPLE